MGDPGLFVRDLRRSAGLTQRDLAYRVAVGFPHISKIESGRERPSLGLCRSIALVLSVSGDHLAARFGYLPDWADELLREHPMLALLALARVSNAVTADEEALVEWHALRDDWTTQPWAFHTWLGQNWPTGDEQ